MNESPQSPQNNVNWLLNDLPLEQQVIGVVGAGTMGAGIAQVAAAAGHPVLLLDARPGAALEAHGKIGAALDSLVSKGRMSAQARAALLERIKPAGQLADFKNVALVIEVIVEQLQAKQALLRELEVHVSRQTILASNTSSISITALANGMRHPDRLVGMHFFNPVPLMKLVEVVSGAETAGSVAGLIFDKARQWGKTPVHAKSTPGFIVNRIARPFYAEALALLQEQAGTPEQLDRLARSAGFRMGPCELMDLIGHDVNYSVTVSVFDANYGDRRYVPSLVQKALVDGGRLGRKTGKGFYEGAAAAAKLPGFAGPTAPIRLSGAGAIAERLASWLEAAKVECIRDHSSDWVGLAIGAVQLRVTDGRSAARMAALCGSRNIGVIDLPLISDANPALGIAFAPGIDADERELVLATLSGSGMQPVELRDVPGLLMARTIAMLINEGADAVYQGVCDEAGADTAMKLGTNYPAGPFEWLAQIGVDYTVDVLNNLFEAYRSERYRVSPLLQQRYWISRMPS